MILYGNVYDVTDFLSSHPGGSKIILKLAGKDATEEYDPVHPPGTLEENLRPEAKLGTVDRRAWRRNTKAEERSSWRQGQPTAASGERRHHSIPC